ncbi:MAG: hypothetical protein Q9211_002976 [Gyalolechia sp. 1 TL-2023]
MAAVHVGKHRSGQGSFPTSHPAPPPSPPRPLRNGKTVTSRRRNALHKLSH